MGRKAGITRDDIVVVAAGIADRDGLDAVTLTAVASKLGIKTPSLYNHVDGLADLKRLITFHASVVLKEVVAQALDGRQGIDALRKVSHADRRFAEEHPGLYESFLPVPDPGDDEELYAAMAEPIFMIAYVMLDMGIPQQEALHLIRAMRSMLHGYLDLEAKGGFGPPTAMDESFEASVELILDGVKAAATKYG